MTGAGSLQKTGGGLLTISGQATYTGATTIDAGTVLLLGVDLLPTTTTLTVNSPGTLDLNGNNQTVGSLSGSGTISLGAGILTVGADNSDTEFSGSMSGSGGLTKQGLGTLLLSGTSTYTGPTEVTAGTLNVTGSLAAPVNVRTGTTLMGTGTIGTLNVYTGATFNPGS